VKSICVTNFELPITFYNISAALGNNVFKVTHGTGSNPVINFHYIVIPDGQYDSTSIVSVINGQMTGQGLTAISFSIVNGKSKFTYTGTYVIDFAINANYPTPYPASYSTNTVINDFDKYAVKSNLGWLLGFRNITYTVVGTTASLTSENLADFNRTHYLYLVADEFSSNSPNSFISPFATSILNKNILAKISLDPKIYPFGSILPANQYSSYLQSDKRTYSGKTNLQRLKIQLVNEYGVPIDLNGSDFSFCLEIEYE
jgi:hypothetical protein